MIYIARSDNRHEDAMHGFIPEARSSLKRATVAYAKSPDSDWYVLRVLNGGEVGVRDLLVEMGIYAHVVQRYEMREYDGKQKNVLVSLLPRLVFAYLPRKEAASYVEKLSPLVSFYYTQPEKGASHAGNSLPLTIDEQEMVSFIRATSTKSKHMKNVDLSKCRFLNDHLVEVVKGNYIGVKGRVARVAGQQCIVVSLANMLWNISTEYIPTPYIRILE